MGTKLWGPDTWYVIHVIADSSPDVFTEKDKASYRRFYESLADVLPCPACAEHYRQFLSRDPPEWKTRVDLLRWTIRAHNHANQVTGAPILTEEEGLTRIGEEVRAREFGRVRGRLPTTWELVQDTAVPVATTIAAMFLLYGLYHIIRGKIEK